ncbi:MAG: diguanylate cyclase, partial [Thermoleophilia bacterium]|nr:diguanylate cyclase [Thermoleophilia bacterium]
MDSISLEEFFSSPHDGSPGVQLHLYRFLHLLASRESLGSTLTPYSYHGAKKLASRLGLVTPERLEALFQNVGLGNLKTETGQEWLRITVTGGPAAATFFADAGNGPAAPAYAGPSPGNMVEAGGCGLEHGLIDGALELITGLPVATKETRCWSRGDGCCVFEAAMEPGGRWFSPRGGTGFREFGEGARHRPVAEAGIEGSLFPGSPANHGPGIRDLDAVLSGHAGARMGQRAWFLDLTGRELARSRRHGLEVSLLYIDLDDLGDINLSRGRTAGDQIISSVASALGRSCRLEDYLWHHGEDEFAVVLAETGPGNARAAAGRLITEIRAAAEYVDFAVKVSASIGFSTFPANAQSLSDLFSSARTALYLAKSKGKGVIEHSDKKPSTEEQHLETGDPEETFPAPRKRPSFRAWQSAQGSEPSRERCPADLSSFRERTGEKPIGREKGGREDAEPETPADAGSYSVVIASVSPLLLSGMRQVMAESAEMEIAGDLTDPSRLSLVTRDIRPDIIFTDKAMALANDFAVPRLLETENLPCKLAVSVPEIDQDIIKLAAGFPVGGIFLQNSSAQEVVDGINRIYQGRTVLPKQVQDAIKSLKKNRRLLRELSDREIEVLRLVAEGKSNSQISKELYITVNTVRFHLANIYQKLGVANRTEAANY